MSDFYADRLFNALERNEVAPGSLLIAAPDLASPEFSRSVILVIEHSHATTFGVNLASRSDLAVANVLPEWTELTALPWNDHESGVWEPEPIRWTGVHTMYRLFGVADRWEEARHSEDTSLIARFGSRLAGLHE